MIRRASPRGVQTTTTIAPSRKPTVMKRCSPWSRRSSSTVNVDPANTSAARAMSSPLTVSVASRFASSNSISLICVHTLIGVVKGIPFPSQPSQLSACVSSGTPRRSSSPDFRQSSPIRRCRPIHETHRSHRQTKPSIHFADNFIKYRSQRRHVRPVVENQTSQRLVPEVPCQSLMAMVPLNLVDASRTSIPVALSISF